MIKFVFHRFLQCLKPYYDDFGNYLYHYSTIPTIHLDSIFTCRDFSLTDATCMTFSSLLSELIMMGCNIQLPIGCSGFFNYLKKRSAFGTDFLPGYVRRKFLLCFISFSLLPGNHGEETLCLQGNKLYQGDDALFFLAFFQIPYDCTSHHLSIYLCRSKIFMS